MTNAEYSTAGSKQIWTRHKRMSESKPFYNRFINPRGKWRIETKVARDKMVVYKTKKAKNLNTCKIKVNLDIGPSY